jgi:hypothetical protein
VEHTITLNPTYLNEGCPPKIYIERVESQRQFLPQEIEKIGNILRPADPFKLHEFGEKSKIAELKVKFEENNQKNISQDISQDIPQDISQNISKMMEATMLGEEESTPILIKGPQKAKVSRTPRKMRKRVQTLTDLTANDDPSNSSKNEEFNDITDSANLNEFKKIMEDPVQ